MQVIESKKPNYSGREGDGVVHQLVLKLFHSDQLPKRMFYWQQLAVLSQKETTDFSYLSYLPFFWKDVFGYGPFFKKVFIESVTVLILF